MQAVAVPSGVRPAAARVAALAPYRSTCRRVVQRTNSASSFSNKRLQCHAVAAPDAPSAVNSKPLVAPGQGQQQVGLDTYQNWDLGAPEQQGGCPVGRPLHSPPAGLLSGYSVPNFILFPVFHTLQVTVVYKVGGQAACVNCDGFAA